MIPATFNESLVSLVDPSRLPEGWQRYPAPGGLARIGARWLAAGKTPVLRVPSAIVPREWNYLLNPSHPRFSSIRIGRTLPLRIDPRLHRLK